jgi:hypothetical protein
MLSIRTGGIENAPNFGFYLAQFISSAWQTSHRGNILLDIDKVMGSDEISNLNAGAC